MGRKSKFAKNNPAYCNGGIRRDAYLYYVKKNYCWIRIAVDRFGKRHVDFVCGDRSTQTFKKLWVKIKDLEVNGFCSDYWKSYSELIPMIPSEKHCESKAETFTIEGYNARIRHYLARFRRKSKCYSKAIYLIGKSLKLLMMKLNNELTRRIQGTNATFYPCLFIAKMPRN